MPCKRSSHTITLFVVLVALTGGVHAQTPPAERSLTLPSGATLKVASDWTVTESRDGLTLEDPDKQLKIEVIEGDASAGMSAIISAAWLRQRPDFNRQELASSDSPGREGWDLFHWVEYKTSPEESRRVVAFVAKKDTHGVIILADGSLAAAQRRSSQVSVRQSASCCVRPRDVCGPNSAASGCGASRIPEDVHRSHARGC